MVKGQEQVEIPIQMPRNQPDVTEFSKWIHTYPRFPDPYGHLPKPPLMAIQWGKTIQHGLLDMRGCQQALGLFIRFIRILYKTYGNKLPILFIKSFHKFENCCFRPFLVVFHKSTAQIETYGKQLERPKTRYATMTDNKQCLVISSVCG